MEGKQKLNISMYWKKSFEFMNRLDTNHAIFQQDKVATHTKTDLKRKKILKFWIGPLSLQV